MTLVPVELAVSYFDPEHYSYRSSSAAGRRSRAVYTEFEPG